MIGDFLCVCPITWTGTLCEERVEQCEEEIKQLPFLKLKVSPKPVVFLLKLRNIHCEQKLPWVDFGTCLIFHDRTTLVSMMLSVSLRMTLSGVIVSQIIMDPGVNTSMMSADFLQDQSVFMVANVWIRWMVSSVNVRMDSQETIANVLVWKLT